MQRIAKWPLGLALVGFIGFFLLTLWRSEQPATSMQTPGHDRVVISAPVLIALYAGDHFLAANLETIRLSATGIDTGSGRVDSFYLIRAHKVASELNPCHEDNFHLANALLTWGGAVDEGSEVLGRATGCRYWDEVPPFYYGFNQYFFKHNIESAQHWLEIAAKRSDNPAAFRSVAIMVEVGQIEEENVALKLLRHQRSKAKSAKLKFLLDQRIVRLEGLAQLRDAQRQYESKTGKPLAQPNLLITMGFLDKFPTDPLNRGFEFVDGKFRFKAVKVAGMEIR